MLTPSNHIGILFLKIFFSMKMQAITEMKAINHVNAQKRVCCVVIDGELPAATYWDISFQLNVIGHHIVELSLFDWITECRRACNVM